MKNARFNKFSHSTSALSAMATILLLLTSCASGPTKTENTSTIEAPSTTKKVTLKGNDQKKFDEALRLLALGELKKSEYILKAIAKKHPHHAPTRANLANIAFQSGNLNSAYMQAKSFDRLAPESGYGQVLLGLIAVEQGDKSNAEIHYIKAITVNTSLADAHYHLAELYDIHLKKYKKAYTHYQRYLSLIPGQDHNINKRLEALGDFITRQ